MPLSSTLGILYWIQIQYEAAHRGNDDELIHVKAVANFNYKT